MYTVPPKANKDILNKFISLMYDMVDSFIFLLFFPSVD